MLRLSVLAALVLGAFSPAIAGTPGAFKPTGEVVATVDGEPITQDMIDVVTERMSPDAAERIRSGADHDRFVEQLALMQMLYEEALAQGLHKDADVKKQLAMGARDTLAGALIEKVAEEGLTDEKLREAYDARAAVFQRPEVRARHILVGEPELAGELLAKLQDGADFAALAEEFSTDPGSAREGGELGWFSQQRMVEPFANAAFAADVGDVVGPVETRFGFHLIEVEGKRDAIPFEEVREDLKAGLREGIITEYLEERRAAMHFELAASSSQDKE